MTMGASVQQANSATPDLLIGAEELHALQSSGAPLSVLDVRWRQDRPEGLPEYLQGHIPGAVFVDLDYELTAPGRPAEEGSHPLPSTEDFQETARRWGLEDGQTVVVYDDLKNLSSARAWWLLRHAGVKDVRVLDGSLRAWSGADLPLDTGIELAEPGSITLSSGTLPTVSADEIASLDDDSLLIDARPATRYSGQEDPLSARPGHIPGAVNVPTSENVDDQGRLLPPEQIRRRYAEWGAEPGKTVFCYCFSGIHSAHTVLALQHAGIKAALYPGGYGQWQQDPENSVAVSPAM